MKIPGVPESLPREKVIDFFKSVGLAANNCTSIELRPDGIYAEMFARTPEGAKVVDPQRGEIVLHKVYIPFVDVVA